MKQTPRIVRIYLLLAALLIALPTIGTKLYHGQTGRFLVASRAINGEPFRESVVYISHHNLFGAFGLVINKPIDMEKLKAVYPALPADAPALHLGGPVGLYDQATALYAERSDDPQEARRIDRDLTIQQVIERVEGYPYKQVYIGYGGWGPLQLEMEVLRGSWRVIDAPKSIIFNTEDFFSLWHRLQEESSRDLYEDQRI